MRRKSIVAVATSSSFQLQGTFQIKFLPPLWNLCVQFGTHSAHGSIPENIQGISVGFESDNAPQRSLVIVWIAHHDHACGKYMLDTHLLTVQHQASVHPILDVVSGRCPMGAIIVFVVSLCLCAWVCPCVFVCVREKKR